MKTIMMNWTLVLMLSAGAAISATADDDQPVDPAYDAALAEELGADGYGMRQYVMAFLKSGPAQGGDPEQVRDIQAAHLAHIRQMAEDGKLVLAGPFMDAGDVRGIFVFAVEDMAEAEALTAADPAVQAGRLVMELKPWYGSAALMQVNSIHQTIAQENP